MSTDKNYDKRTLQLAVDAAAVLAEVEAWRAEGRKMAERLKVIVDELDVAVPEDERFDNEVYGDGTTSVLIAASGLETGVEVEPRLQGAIDPEDWARADYDYDLATAGGSLELTPVEV